MKALFPPQHVVRFSSFQAERPCSITPLSKPDVCLGVSLELGLRHLWPPRLGYRDSEAPVPRVKILVVLAIVLGLGNGLPSSSQLAAEPCCSHGAQSLRWETDSQVGNGPCVMAERYRRAERRGETLPWLGGGRGRSERLCAEGAHGACGVCACARVCT